MLLQRYARSVCIVVALGLAGACDPIKRTHGYVPQDGKLKSVEVGADNKATVAGKIGRPTTTGTFDNDEWFYISRQTVDRAFLQPKVISQEVVAVAFNEDGIATSVDRYGLEDGKVVNLVTRTTPTRGKRLTFLQQLLGNIGRFNASEFSGGTKPGTF